MLNKLNRITKQREFDAFFGKEFKLKKGKNMAGRFMILKVFKNELKTPRFGFMLNTKVDKRAVVRNRIKRQLRESIRLRLKEFKGSFDCLIVVKPTVKDIEAKELEKELFYLFKKANIL
ncbi:ribonuclease P protein component [Candidatus Kuenenbacteria bacterium]|nr:ribonuclease P protein component [Candidatus Kuenenbacteria bacterium]